MNNLDAAETRDLLIMRSFYSMLERRVGAESTRQVWDTVTQVAPDLVYSLFLANLKGGVIGDTVLVRGKFGYPHKIPMIKALREATYMGLKEAKDFCEELLDDPDKVKEVKLYRKGRIMDPATGHPRDMDAEEAANEYHRLVRMLTNNGFILAD